jgi:hypothetical protein
MKKRLRGDRQEQNGVEKRQKDEAPGETVVG